MASNKEIGRKGEETAQVYLANLGYSILEMNWRFKKAEIDIIAKDKETLVFIEVKTRSYSSFGDPEEFISDKQEALIIDAAQRYMEKIGHDWEIRFDIISILVDKTLEINKIDHFKDAFFY